MAAIMRPMITGIVTAAIALAIPMSSPRTLAVRIMAMMLMAGPEYGGNSLIYVQQRYSIEAGIGRGEANGIRIERNERIQRQGGLQGKGSLPLYSQLRAVADGRRLAKSNVRR
jgi:hypothetical protein